MRKSVAIGAVVGLALVGATAVEAHHAVNAQFDVEKHIIFDGVLKKVDWQNPHAWFHFDVKQPNGTTVTWSCETVGPNGLRRLGLSDRRLFVIGQTYKVDGNPDRSGKPICFTNSFVFPDGKLVVIGFPDEPGGEPPRNN
jgi:Family of unknown function (DUF6152)